MGAMAKLKPGLYVEVTNPILSKHKKFLNLVGKVRAVTDDNIEGIDAVFTAMVDFQNNPHCTFEFLAEELTIVNEPAPEQEVKEPEEEEKKEEEPKYHKARQDDLAGDNVPIIPDKKRGGNNLRTVFWDDAYDGPIAKHYTNDASSEFMVNYILGNVFRSSDIFKFRYDKMMYHRISSLYDKQRDWAWIERKIYNGTRKDNFYNKDTDPVDWKTRLSDPKNILLSKYAQNDHYYKFIIGTDRFIISKVIMPCVNKKGMGIPGGIPDTVYARAAIDYATGNFFTSIKDAKRSIMFQKLKTFFKYMP